MSALEQSSRSLAELEAVIEAGLEKFMEVGVALREIRDGKKYGQDTFEDYCKERWDMGRNYANKLIAAVEVVRVIQPLGTSVPTSEAQARGLTQLLERPDKLREVWTEVVERHPDPTAANVREVVQEHIGPMSNKATINASAEVRRVHKALSSIEGFCSGLSGIRVDRVLSIATPDELKAWEKQFESFMPELARFRRSLKEEA